MYVDATASTIEFPAIPDLLTDSVESLKGLTLMGTGSMFVLAALDLIGAWCAMRYMHTGHPGWWSAGAAVFVLLFSVYAASLHWAELGTVTLGWIVLLQIGVLVMDRINGTVLPFSKWIAVGAILTLMGYVLLAPNQQAYRPKHAARPAKHSETVLAERTTR